MAHGAQGKRSAHLCRPSTSRLDFGDRAHHAKQPQKRGHDLQEFRTDKQAIQEAMDVKGHPSHLVHILGSSGVIVNGPVLRTGVEALGVSLWPC